MRGRWLTVLALVVLTSSGCRDTSSQPAAAPSPSPSAVVATTPEAVTATTSVPSWYGGALHVGDLVLPTPRPTALVYRAPTVLIGRGPYLHRRWSILGPDHREVPLPTAEQPETPMLAADGGTVAWVDRTGSSPVTDAVDEMRSDVRYRVVVYDVARQRPTSVLHRVQRVTCCDAVGFLYLGGVLDDGRVLLGLDHQHAEIWRPGADPVALPPPVDIEAVPAWPPGVMFRGRSSDREQPGVLVRLDRQGHRHRAGAVTTTDDGEWSANGRFFAHLYRGGRVAVETFGRKPLEPRPLGLPSVDGSWEVVAWEDASHVVVAAYDPAGEHVEDVELCSARALTCLPVPGALGAGRTVLPSSIGWL